ncbi:MAG TPA: DUF1700 domain-containing protein [Spirochaetia bacterium]|nr:DUF1700 domain-containing protein [Spirochaetia bacterium]
MRRDEFLSELRRALGRMPEQEKREVLYDYEEHFRAALQEGKTEEDVARALGNPRLLGKSYAIDALLENPRPGEGVSAVSVIRALLTSISLTFFNVIVVLGPFLGLVGAMVGLWAAAVSLPLAGVGVVLSPLAAAIVPQYYSLGGASPAFFFFAGLGVTGLGLLAVLGMWKLSRLFVQITAAYVRFNARIVTRRRQGDIR